MLSTQTSLLLIGISLVTLVLIYWPVKRDFITQNNVKDSMASSISKSVGNSSSKSRLVEQTAKESLTTEEPSFDTVRKRLSKVRQCIQTQFPSQHPLWNIFHTSVLSCSRAVFTESFNFIYFRADKLFLKLRNPIESGKFGKPHATNSGSWRNYYPCVSVTFGIGGEVMMEQDLQAKYPECEFHGADPFPGVSMGFLQFGVYHVIAVDESSQKQRGNMQLLPNMRSQYAPRSTDTKELKLFLEQDIRRPIIHFATFDVEGSEYRLMPYLIQQRKKRLESKAKPRTGVSVSEWIARLDTPVICQLNIELHGEFHRRDMTNEKWDKIVTEFLTQSDFVPLMAYDTPQHHRLYTFNAGDPQCVELFDWSPEPKPWNEYLVNKNKKAPPGKGPPQKFSTSIPKI